MIGAFHDGFKSWSFKKDKNACFAVVDFQLALNFFHLTLNFEQLDIAAKSLKYIDIFKY